MPLEGRMQPPAEDSALPLPEAAGPSTDAPVGLAGRLYWWVCIVIIAVDQATKFVVNSRLPVFDSVSIIPGLLDFTHVQNKGVAFGLLNDAPMGAQAKAAITTVLAVM